MISNKCLIIVLYYLVFTNRISSQSLSSGSACTLLDGSPGICKSGITCKSLEYQIKSKLLSLRDLYKLRCSFENNVEILCCGDEASERKSKKACDLYRVERQPVISYHILNGTFALLGEFPHMVALGYESNKDNQQYDFKCGGSLISDRYILTAAHCTSKLKPIVARLGTLNIITPEVDPVNYGQVLDVNIESTVQHPEYISIKNNHDLALIRLSQSVPFTRNLHPACLYTDLSDNLPNTELYITGWGVSNISTEIRSPFLLKTNLTVVNINECNRTLTPFYNKKIRFLTFGHFCAYDPKGESDACQGDSGGPIQLLDTVTDGRTMPVIVGITSFGVACGTKLPSVYTRVSFYLDWIESIVWPE